MNSENVGDHPNRRIEIMDDLIKGFKESAGNFEEWHNGLSQREKVLFKKWLQNMRDNPPIGVSDHDKNLA